ncbi:MAG TPA: SHOCT domain-containing protein [Propionicimonas sp.]|nr:SHOCT domain-containing protein [Propionicimonas sp.]
MARAHTERTTAIMDFWGFLWLMIWGFFFIMYLMILFQIILDVFRDKSMNGGVKALWLIALLFIPLITALIYVIVRGKGMTEREVAAAQQSRAATEDYIRSVSGATDPAAQIANAKALLDAGTITQAEFDQIKAKALA